MTHSREMNFDLDKMWCTSDHAMRDIIWDRTKSSNQGSGLDRCQVQLALHRQILKKNDISNKQVFEYAFDKVSVSKSSNGSNRISLF